ncbi:hypothetical protein J2Z48_000970 [Croceifilum oryzae]|uniref:Uncharacterized protein n=1 Tax=Croceifilum oryzae TaxID=1553429 RepID=A0AAJ1WS98_9BACL|nr:hypothetical protein [Croceifilum oryzae]
MVTGLLPLLNINVALVLTIRGALGNASITLTGDFELTAGDVIGAFYVADGLATSLTLSPVSPSSTVWSVHRLT